MGVNKARPLEKGNAQTINQVCRSTIQLPLVRYSALTDFYTEEPKHIGITVNESDNSCNFEQIFRFRMWIPNQMTCSWLIYSKNREWLNDENEIESLLLRHVIWRRDLDLETVKKTYKENKEIVLNNWPLLEIENIFLKPQMCAELVEILREGDKILSKGITLKERESKKNPIWRDIEVNRMFDWGTVHAVWCPFMENKEVEKYVLNLNKHLEKYAKIKNDTIYKIDLDFSYPPEMYKNLINGIEK